jgi:hypothetical protein
MKITEFTICLHCGCDYNIVKSQMDSLSILNSKYNVFWNNRIDRYPYAYPSYSELINHSIITSNTEIIIFINDRTFPTPSEVESILEHLENGYACSFMYNAGFMGFSKSLIGKIGWWDERFLGGGWEDVDWVFRLKLNNLALYESCDSTYSYSWKSPLQDNDKCMKSEPEFFSKYTFLNDKIIKNFGELYNNSYTDILINDNFAWKSWDNSTLGKNYIGPNKGNPASYHLIDKLIIENNNV